MKHFHIQVKDSGRSEETFVNFAWALARCSVWAMQTGFVDAYKPILCEESHDKEDMHKMQNTQTAGRIL